MTDINREDGHKAGTGFRWPANIVNQYRFIPAAVVRCAGGMKKLNIRHPQANHKKLPGNIYGRQIMPCFVIFLTDLSGLFGAGKTAEIMMAGGICPPGTAFSG